MYSITFSDTSLKQLDNLEKKTLKRITSAIERCRIRPHAHIKKLVESPYFSLRVGDYRVIMRIIENELRILVVKIGHRKNIYKK
jgi:mRNA interferase RelE/StbE